MKKVDWTKWSAIAEILSAIAIVVTLLYLADQTQELRVQTEQNNKLLRAEAIGSVLETRLGYQDQMLASVDIADLRERNETQEQLSPQDRRRLRSLYSQAVIGWQKDYFLYQEDILPEGYMRANFRVMKRAIFEETGAFSAAEFWEEWSRESGTPEFVELVETCVRLDWCTESAIFSSSWRSSPTLLRAARLWRGSSACFFRFFSTTACRSICRSASITMFWTAGNPSQSTA